MFLQYITNFKFLQIFTAYNSSIIFTKLTFRVGWMTDGYATTYKVSVLNKTLKEKWKALNLNWLVTEEIKKLLSFYNNIFLFNYE